MLCYQGWVVGMPPFLFSPGLLLVLSVTVVVCRSGPDASIYCCSSCDQSVITNGMNM